MRYWAIQPTWRGETIYIVGGGPSLSALNWEALQDRKVIGINRAFRNLGANAIIYFRDRQFWVEHRRDLLAHPSDYLVTTNTDIASKNRRVRYVIPNGMRGIEFTSRHHVREGRNSGVGAIGMAVHLGAARIVLLGFDLDHDQYNRTHWHEGYGYNHNRSKLEGYTRELDLQGDLLKSSTNVQISASTPTRLNPKIWNPTTLREEGLCSTP